jgi:hypothetical protein
MNPKILKALKESIKHWQRLATGTRLLDEGMYGEDCALCNICYRHAWTSADMCPTCPIAQRLGMGACKAGPWVDCCDFKKHFDGEEDGLYQQPEFQKRAHRMLQFLQSLLPSAKSKANLKAKRKSQRRKRKAKCTLMIP